MEEEKHRIMFHAALRMTRAQRRVMLTQSQRDLLHHVDYMLEKLGVKGGDSE